MNVIKNLSLAKKFLLGIGLIVFFFWALFSYLIYSNLRDTYIAETFGKTDMLFSHIQSTMSFIRKDLRPLMFHVLPSDEFIKEAMSVSFITKSIMTDFRKEYPSIVYRRVSLDPMNPDNRADAREAEFIGSFRSGAAMNAWKGVKIIDDRKYAYHIRPIVIEAECLSCHGRPEEAPRALRAAYGTLNGFNKKLGEVIGVEYISIPLDNTFIRIKELVMSVFLVGIVGMFLMFAALNSYINYIAVTPIKKIRGFFRSVIQGDKGLDTKFAVRTGDEIGEVAHAFNQMMDYLKTSQEKLISSEKQYRQIFEGSQDAIIAADCQGLIQEINQAGVALFGCRDKMKVMSERTVFDMFVRKEDYAEFVRAMETQGHVKNFETRLRRVDGKIVDVLMSANYREDENRTICGFETIIKDITERKKFLERINEAERLAAIGQLAAGIAHEINNPLSVIIGYSKLLLEDGSLEGGARKDMLTVHENASACRKIIDDLLKFSRRTETHFEHHHIHTLIESVLDMLSYEFEKKQISITRLFDHNIPPVLADGDKIRQVIMNLLINALQAVPDGGAIEIRTVLTKDRSGVTLSISDNGPGIPEDIREKVFQPFFTTKPVGQGTGLGLAVSYGIIKEHGGEIDAGPNGKRGATFSIRLPVTAPEIKERT